MNSSRTSSYCESDSADDVETTYEYKRYPKHLIQQQTRVPQQQQQQQRYNRQRVYYHQYDNHAYAKGYEAPFKHITPDMLQLSALRYHQQQQKYYYQQSTDSQLMNQSPSHHYPTSYYSPYQISYQQQQQQQSYPYYYPYQRQPYFVGLAHNSNSTTLSFNKPQLIVDPLKKYQQPEIPLPALDNDNRPLNNEMKFIQFNKLGSKSNIQGNDEDNNGSIASGSVGINGAKGGLVDDITEGHETSTTQNMDELNFKMEIPDTLSINNSLNKKNFLNSTTFYSDKLQQSKECKKITLISICVLIMCILIVTGSALAIIFTQRINENNYFNSSISNSKQLKDFNENNTTKGFTRLFSPSFNLINTTTSDVIMRLNTTSILEPRTTALAEKVTEQVKLKLENILLPQNLLPLLTKHAETNNEVKIDTSTINLPIVFQQDDTNSDEEITENSDLEAQESSQKEFETTTMATETMVTEIKSLVAETSTPLGKVEEDQIKETENIIQTTTGLEQTTTLQEVTLTSSEKKDEEMVESKVTVESSTELTNPTIESLSKQKNELIKSSTTEESMKTITANVVETISKEVNNELIDSVTKQRPKMRNVKEMIGPLNLLMKF